MEIHLIAVDYSFRGLVNYHHGVTWWLAGAQGGGKAAEWFDLLPTGNKIGDGLI